MHKGKASTERKINHRESTQTGANGHKELQNSEKTNKQKRTNSGQVRSGQHRTDIRKF